MHPYVIERERNRSTSPARPRGRQSNHAADVLDTNPRQIQARLKALQRRVRHPPSISLGWRGIMTITVIGSATSGTSTPTIAVRAALRRWQGRMTRLFDPYRPELHYMRGPGPKWRAKHGSAAWRGE
jgi:hypothetical protein